MQNPAGPPRAVRFDAYGTLERLMNQYRHPSAFPENREVLVLRAGLPLEPLDTAPTRSGSSLRDVLDFFPV